MILQVFSDDIRLLRHYASFTGPVVLLQNAVYAASEIAETYPNFIIYALSNDYEASGLALIDEVKLIDILQWVALCSEHHPVVSIQ